MRTHGILARSTSLLCTVAFFSAVTGCANFKPPPVYPIEDPAYKPSGVSREGLAKDPPVGLTLLPGDTVTVNTMSSETNSYTGLIVDGEGKVHIPIAGPVVVANLSPAQAENAIEQVVQKFDRFVRVSVIVTGWGGHTATVIGAVVNEGPKPLTPNMRLAELIAEAGGPLKTGDVASGGEFNYLADLDGARLVRNGEALPVSVRLALEGDPKHNVLIHPGDQLFMPAGLGSRIAVLGRTGGGGTMISYRPGIRLTEALASSGGLTIAADDDDIRVIRGPLKNPIIYRYDFEKLVKGKGTDIELAPGDVVFVSENWLATVGDVINRVSPLLSVLITGLQTYIFIKTLQNQNNASVNVNTTPTNTTTNTGN